LFKRVAVLAGVVALACAAPSARAVEPVPGGTGPNIVMSAGDDPKTMVTQLDLPPDYDQLTDEEKKYVPTEASVTVEVNTEPSAAPAKGLNQVTSAATYCSSGYVYYTVRASYGVVYKLQANIDRWCWNGSKVLSTYPIRSTASVNNLAMIQGWEYNGIVDKEQWQPGGTTWYYRNYLSANFRYCPIRVGACLVSQVPWVMLDTNGRGGTAASWGRQ
jgi:hypothetical protein